MTLNIENIDQLQDLSQELKVKQTTEARMASLAARRLLNEDDEQAIADSLWYPEYKKGAEIAYTYDCMIGTDSFEWRAGYWNQRESEWDIKPHFNLSLETKPDEKQYSTDLRGVVKSISSKRFTEKTRQSIESSAPMSLQVIGLHNGMEIINPYDLQKWMKDAGVLDQDDSILPIKMLVKPPRKPESVAESDFPARKDDELSYIVDTLIIEPAVSSAEAGILNYPDKGEPRGVIKEWEESDAIGVDAERMRHLIEIRDSWQDAQIVETESLVGDKTRYVALILPESEVNVYGFAKEWAIAENPLEGNALFIVDPHKLEDGIDWRDVLLDTSKKAAQSMGAIKKVHTPDGKWKERVLDIITAPANTP
ncbi:MAG: hypothetical protein WAV04_03510 [Candidatus Microsaccharimonas sp.]